MKSAFDLAAELNRAADAGLCPCVVFDDDGHWAIENQWISNCRGKDDDYECGILCNASSFKPTIEEAWDSFLKRMRSEGAEI